ncbi:cytochrome C oxidase subunit IV family protein [Halolamina sp. CBA1230]|uniref:cytochrome C oxidase subunit IV family protein n=1 Tax=Halolamina sp. CBA1230 TaxID=1853690 RepID=UPI0009A24E40|nr:cytochrome C oxidase subunit IV family protein [Halolamina sp. CBA1230]QKY19957.1 cytochrome C oxidase subunit IV family protein [Halolamina sp. CBA1230]
MARTKLYTGIYVALFVFATLQVGVEQVGLLEENYLLALGLITALSLIKGVIVAGYFQHLVWEPRSVTYVMLLGVVGFLALTVAASYSIQ